MAVTPLPHQAQRAGQFVIGHLATNFTGDFQHEFHLVGAEPVVAAGLKENAPARAMAVEVFFVATPALPGVAHAGRPLGDDQAAYVQSGQSQRLGDDTYRHVLSWTHRVT